MVLTNLIQMDLPNESAGHVGVFVCFSGSVDPNWTQKLSEVRMEGVQGFLYALIKEL